MLNLERPLLGCVAERQRDRAARRRDGKRAAARGHVRDLVEWDRQADIGGAKFQSLCLEARLSFGRVAIERRRAVRFITHLRTGPFWPSCRSRPSPAESLDVCAARTVRSHT